MKPLESRLPQRTSRLAMLKHIFDKFSKLLSKARKWMPPEDSRFYRVRYTSTPVWKPWRDY
jgi:hypothetical protein